MYANCGSRKTRRSVEIISLAFKWLMVLRSAIKHVIKRTESLKMRMPCPKTRTKCMFMRLAHRLYSMGVFYKKKNQTKNACHLCFLNKNVTHTVES